MDNYRLLSRKYHASLPLIIALGALLIIAVPLAKLINTLKRDITEINYEMRGLKKQVNFVEISPEDNQNNLNIPKLDRECSAAVKSLIKEELATFDSDKTGKTDFALESSGGSIVNTLKTVNYSAGRSLFGFTLCEGTHGPRSMIQATTAAGECWAFKGSKGGAIIKLLGKVKIDSISLEHISAVISPTGDLRTAPKDFLVYGLTCMDCCDKDKVLLGTFTYRTGGPPIQTFRVDPHAAKIPFEYVEFWVESNYGSPEYTCVYRFRVHGTLDSICH